MRKEVIKANIVVFIASFCTLVIELVAGRIMAPYVGVSLYTWTSIIGVVLAGISIGAFAGGLLADRYPRSSTLGWLLFLSGIGALSISPLTNLIGGAHFQTSLMVRILLLTTIIFFIPSCLLGMISPVVVKLTLNNLDKTGNVVGKIYAFSTLGSILGTFATGFYLISWMGTRHILLTMGVILIVSAPIFGGFFARKKTLLLFLIFLSLLVVLPVAGLYVYAASRPAEVASPANPIHSLKTLYGYAFNFPVDEETYFYEESDYYTIKLKKKERSDGGPMEALVLDQNGHLSEGSAMNIFMLRDGVLITPPITDNILEGITRQTIIELAKDELGLQVAERSIDRTEVFGCEELFMTGTAAGITAVTKIDHRPVGVGVMGPITTKLRELYDGVIRARNPKYMHWSVKV